LVPLIVIVAERLLVELLAAAVTFIVPLLLPEDGETVHHDWLDETVHESLDVTVIFFVSPAAANDRDAGLTASSYDSSSALQ
jgi:hypothetical protein